MGEATSRRIVGHARSVASRRWAEEAPLCARTSLATLNSRDRDREIPDGHFMQRWEDKPCCVRLYVEADLREHKYTIEQAENLKGSRTRSKMIRQSWTRTY